MDERFSSFCPIFGVEISDTLKFKVFFFLRYITRHLFSWRYWIWCPAYSGLTGKNKPYWFSEEPFIELK